MNGRRILVIAICCTAAFGRGLAFGNDSSAGFGSDDAIDRPITIMPSPTSAPGAAAVEMPSAETLGGNPLWGIPLEVLNATRERPLFSPSRRPPMAAVIGPPVQAVEAAAPAAPQLTLNLLGTVEGDGEGYAVLIDTTTHDVVRLKTGEGEGGWILRSVSEREVVLENNGRTEVLKLPAITDVTK